MFEEDGKFNFWDIFNFKKMSRHYKVSLWECPPFIFTVMGVIIILAILISYVVGRTYVDPIVLALVILAMAFVLFVLAFIIMNSFERIAHAVREKAEFISIMSHQLRNPLSSVKWQLNFLFERGTGISNEQNRESLLSIEEQNEKMIILVNDLLDITRFENNTMIFSEIPFSLTGMIKESVGFCAGKAVRANIDINFFPLAEDVQIIADRTKIKDAFCHLLDNAIRYSPEGGRVNIAMEKEPDKVKVSVNDEGIGIAETDKRNIFKKFFRGSSSKKYKSDGLGIGLFLAKIIIEHSGGKINFTSAEGKGSNFWFTLPLKD